MFRKVDSLKRTLLESTGLRAILATAAIAALPGAALASDHNWNRDHDGDRDHDRGARVEVRIGDHSSDCSPASTLQRVWVEPVYRTVCERQYVPPVYRTVMDRVWREESMQTATDRVWVPDRYEDRDVESRDRRGRHVTRERLFVPAHYEDQSRQVCVPAHYEDVPRQELVCDGHWENVQRQELVAPGHWETQQVVIAPRYEDHPHARIDIRFPF